jgi:membrane protease subunit (stomatin/prohibitin family)
MPFRRRRPLLRAAVVGGGAYAVGRSAANRSAQQAQQESRQDGRINDLEAQQAQQAPQAPVPQQAAQPATESMIDQLSKLSELHGQGALTDAEFTTAKAKLLGNGNG